MPSPPSLFGSEGFADSSQGVWCHLKNLLLVALPSPLLHLTPPCAGLLGWTIWDPCSLELVGFCQLSLHYHSPLPTIQLYSLRTFACLDIPALSSVDTHLMSKITSKTTLMMPFLNPLQNKDFAYPSDPSCRSRQLRSLLGSSDSWNTDWLTGPSHYTRLNVLQATTNSHPSTPWAWWISTWHVADTQFLLS